VRLLGAAHVCNEGAMLEPFPLLLRQMDQLLRPVASA